MLVSEEVGSTMPAVSTVSYMAERYTRKRRTEPSDLVYEFTRDPGYLHQYYLLREKMYIKVWGLTHFEAPEDEYDRNSHIIVVRRGNHVVGGGRLTVSGPRKETLLPLEDENFRLRDLFPELKLEHNKYAEFSRMAIETEFQDGQCTVAMFEQVRRKLIALNVPHLFAMAPLPSVRLYRKACKSIGLNLVARQDIAIPERDGHEGIRMCMYVVPIMDTPIERSADKKVTAEKELSPTP